MLGVRSDGCGVLRTCCRQSPIPDFEIPDYQLAVNYPTHSPNDISKRFQNQFQPSIQHIIGYGKPQRPHNYDNVYPHRPIEAFPSQMVQSSYGMPNKPLNPIDYDEYIPQPISPHIPVPIKPSLAPIQPLRPLPYPNQAYKPQPAPHSIDGIVSNSGYGVCGRRHAVGIHGRVQNLQYHESSTEFGEFPWQVAILKRLGPADSLYVCGGALVSPLFIVTAAHCLKK